ncbi:MAG: rhodanese-like domain-containing protein [Burkholderiaceae bacterium]|nr:rhodanese-like domain-containing protein [Burkholderiaceae bacterium]
MERQTSAASLQAALAAREPLALLDVREMGEYRLGHIFGATPLPLGDLEERARRYVPQPHLEVVVCGGDDGRQGRAAQRLRAMGFSNVSVLAGGVSGWQQEGRAGATGWGFEGKQFGEQVAVAERIPHVDAEEVAAGLDDPEVIVLDSRTPAEFLKGHIPGARWLPPFQSLLHAADLCRAHRSVYVNCAGRTRSLLGARLLRGMGFDNVYAVQNGTWGWLHSGRKLEKGEGATVAPPTDAALAQADAYARALAGRRGIDILDADQARHFTQAAASGYVVDVRGLDAFRAAHVPGSFHIEGSLLQFLAEERFAVRSLPVLVIGEQTADGAAGAALLRDLGYAAYCIEGGFAAWQSSDAPTQAGDEQWPDAGVPEPGMGAVEILDWPVASRRLHDGAAVALDLRSLGDFTLGHLPGALSLPLGRLEEMHASLVKGLAYIAVGEGRKAVRGAARLRAAGFNAAALDIGMAELARRGLELVEGLDGSNASLDDAKQDVDPFRRKGALRQSVGESHAYLQWERALAHPEAHGVPITTTA